MGFFASEGGSADRGLLTQRGQYRSQVGIVKQKQRPVTESELCLPIKSRTYTLKQTISIMRISRILAVRCWPGLSIQDSAGRFLLALSEGL